MSYTAPCLQFFLFLYLSISPARTTLAAIPPKVANRAPAMVYLVLFTLAAIKYTETV